MRKNYCFQLNLEVDIDGEMSEELAREKVISSLYEVIPSVFFDSEDSDDTKELDCVIFSTNVELILKEEN